MLLCTWLRSKLETADAMNELRLFSTTIAGKAYSTVLFPSFHASIRFRFLAYKNDNFLRESFLVRLTKWSGNTMPVSKGRVSPAGSIDSAGLVSTGHFTQHMQL